MISGEDITNELSNLQQLKSLSIIAEQNYDWLIESKSLLILTKTQIGASNPSWIFLNILNPKTDEIIFVCNTPIYGMIEGFNEDLHPIVIGNIEVEKDHRGQYPRASANHLGTATSTACITMDIIFERHSVKVRNKVNK
ncbi:hypothetical protein H8356DRAFT_1321739 [Neocallimastix lanati (nom. inval.)]|nr:hypothetical protein H8356DRAFT_1321739 [Neocallimastix sp. JGI-2020a]